MFLVPFNFLLYIWNLWESIEPATDSWATVKKMRTRCKIECLLIAFLYAIGMGRYGGLQKNYAAFPSSPSSFSIGVIFSNVVFSSLEEKYQGCTSSSRCLDMYLTSLNSREQSSVGDRQRWPLSRYSGNFFLFLCTCCSQVWKNRQEVRVTGVFMSWCKLFIVTVLYKHLTVKSTLACRVCSLRKNGSVLKTAVSVFCLFIYFAEFLILSLEVAQGASLFREALYWRLMTFVSVWDEPWVVGVSIQDVWFLFIFLKLNSALLRSGFVILTSSKLITVFFTVVLVLSTIVLSAGKFSLKEHLGSLLKAFL